MDHQLINFSKPKPRKKQLCTEESHFSPCICITNALKDTALPLQNGLRQLKDTPKFLLKYIPFFFNKFIYLFIFGCAGSSFLCEGFLQLQQAGSTLHRGVLASHYRGLSCCGAQAPDAQAQQLWLTGPVALWHVGSSKTGARTRVPCTGRQTLNHCATREALKHIPFQVYKIYTLVLVTIMIISLVISSCLLNKNEQVIL